MRVPEFAAEAAVLRRRLGLTMDSIRHGLRVRIAHTMFSRCIAFVRMTPVQAERALRQLWTILVTARYGALDPSDEEDVLRICHDLVQGMPIVSNSSTCRPPVQTRYFSEGRCGRLRGEPDRGSPS